ncbi:MAG TPA: PP2C family protein-serine/threonine phosphatase [Candidatus Limnocylindrales bacterium]|nr:PP2C family protein-serine/threonine phosphatase [Candidatus Limnocylindrales bacterium]
MMALTEKTQDCSREPFANLASTGSGLHAAVSERVESIHSLRVQLDALRREHERLQQAVFEAAQVQRRLCAPRELTWGEFEIAGEIFPVRHLSGDFFKVMELDSALGLAVGDIAGKGLTAGVWQTHLMGLIQRCARRHSNPAEVVREVNHELCLNSVEAPLTALFFARLDSQSNKLEFCNAGLPAPLLLRHDKSVELLEAGGPMLGALQSANFEAGSVQLNPGDMLVAYSDGVTECRNPQDNEFETARLTAVAGAVSGATASRALFSTLGAVLDFAEACPPADDLTLLVVRRRSGIPGERTRSRSKDFLAPHPRLAPTDGSKPADERGRGSK